MIRDPWDEFTMRNPFPSRPSVGDLVRGYVSGSITPKVLDVYQQRFIDAYRCGDVTLERVGKPRVSKVAGRPYYRADWTYRIVAVGPRWYEADWSI